MANINTMSVQQRANENNAYAREALGAQIANAQLSDSIQKNTGGSQSRKAQYDISKKTERELKRFMGQSGIDPYDNTPGGTKVPKDKLMSLTNGAYTSQLLEKILKASDNSAFQNTTLKFQEQTLSYMQSMSADIKLIADNFRDKGQGEQQDEDNGLEMEVSGLAKALSEVNIEGIAKEIGKSIYSKMDSSGYGDLVKTMYQSMKDAIQGGEFSTMVKGMIQNTMLKQLPQELQHNIEEFRNDPVKLMQMQLNKLATSDNRALRDIFGSMYKGMKPDLSPQEKKIDMSAKALFDNKFYTSVTKIIPEQLYKIVAALEGKEQMIFDWDKQDYISESEEVARRLKARGGTSPEEIMERAMNVYDYMFEQAANNKSFNASSVFQMDGDKIKRDNKRQIQFKSARIKEIITKMTTSKLMPEQFATASPFIIMDYIGIDRNKKDAGLYMADIQDIQLMFRMSGFEDNQEAMTDIVDLKTSIHNANKVSGNGMIDRSTQALMEQIMTSSNMSVKTKDRLLNMINRQGIHSWGAGGTGGNFAGAGGNGRPSTGDGYVRANNIDNSMSMNTDFNTIMEMIRNYNDNPENLDPRDMDKTNDYINKVLNSSRTKFKPDDLKPQSKLAEFKDKIESMSQRGALSPEDYAKLKAVTNPGALNANEQKIFDNATKKIELASQLYKTLTDAGLTAPSMAAKLGITLKSAKDKGYISSPIDLMKVIREDGSIDTKALVRYNMQYLDPDSEEWKYVQKQARTNTTGILGRGTLSKQLSGTLSSIFGDPKIANKAGIAIGSAAGLGVAKILKDQGIVTNPKFGWLLGAVGGSLMTMQRTRNFVNDVFGPDGDIKGSNGYTNKEIFMAKAMSQYLPAIGVGGKAATMIMKGMSAFGPFGKAMGLIAGPILGYGIGMATAAVAPRFGDWLFKERDEDSKLGKFAKVLKEIPFVKRFFNLADERNDTEVRVDAVKKLASFYRGKAAEMRAKGKNDEAERYKKLADDIENHADDMERSAQRLRKEERKSDPNEEIIKGETDTINKHWEEIDNIIKATGNQQDQEDFNRFVNEEEDARTETNRRSGAAKQKYNRTDPEEMEKLQEKLSQIWEADDDRRESMRRLISGEDDLASTEIKDDKLRKEFESIVYLQSKGEDVGGRYRKWLRLLKQKEPDTYELLVDRMESGSKAARLKDQLLQDIMNDIKGKNPNITDIELRQQAANRLQMALNNQGLVRGISSGSKNLFGNLTARLMGRMNGVDEDDYANAEDEMSVFTNYGFNTYSHGDESKLNRTKQEQRRVDAYKFMLNNYNRGMTPDEIQKYWRAKYGNKIGDLSEKEIRRIISKGSTSNRLTPQNRDDEILQMAEEYTGNNKKSSINRYWREVYGHDDNLTSKEMTFFMQLYSDMNDGKGGRGTDLIKMSQLSKKHFKSGESLSVAGCSVVAITNALIYMGIDAPEPDTLIGIANRYLTKDGGITSDFFLEVSKNLNITATIYNNKDNKFTVDVFKNFKPGKNFGLILLLKNQFNAGYHYVTVKSITGRKLYIDDPEQRGIQEVTAAEIVSRLVEIITFKAEVEQESLTEEISTTDIVGSAASATSHTGIKGAIMSKLQNSLKDMSIALPTVPFGTGAGNISNTGGSIVGSIIEALKNAVFNVRVVDDLTLPLKMGDKDAALAISRLQMAQELPQGVKRYASFIKKGMQNKDIQHEFEQQDLVQEAILNGGLVAGGSSGAGGRGTGQAEIGQPQRGSGFWGSVKDLVTGGNPAKPGGSKWRRIFDSGKNLVTGGLTAIGNLAGSAIPVATGLALGKLVKDVAVDKGGSAIRNLFHNYGEEDEQVVDENGNQIKRGNWRDISGSVRNLKDVASLTKGAIAAQGLVGAGVKTATNAMKGSKFKVIKKVGETLASDSGSLSWITKAINKAFIEVPAWITSHIIENPKIASIVGGSGILKDAVDSISGFIVKACNGLKEKVGKKLATKAASLLGKKGGGGLLRKLINKMPGGALMMAMIQMPIAAYTGWRHAGQYLDRDNARVNVVDKLKVMFAKICYDCLPDIIMGTLTAANPVMGLVTDAGLAIIRMVWTWDDCLKFFGLKKAGQEEKDAALVAYDALSKLEKDGKVPEGYKDTVLASKAGKSTAKYEGFRSTAYHDTEGKLTIGYGFNLDSGRFKQEDVDRWLREGITKEEADQVLKQELERTRAQLEKYEWFQKMDKVRQDAIVDMTYNMGIGWLDKFKNARAALEKGDFDTASAEILNSNYAHQVGQRAVDNANRIKYGSMGTDDISISQINTMNADDIIGLNSDSRYEEWTKGKSAGYADPVKSPYITSVFGDRSMYNGRLSSPHKGIDLYGKRGDNIYAIDDGEVVGLDPAYGTISIKHADGTISKYTHCSAWYARMGEKVKKGQVIAAVGGTGPGGVNDYKDHLHFSFLNAAGKNEDPLLRLGLDPNRMKLNTKTGPENIKYVTQNPWINKISKSIVDKATKEESKKPDTKPENKEAGGPPANIDRNPTNGTTTIINRDKDLERLVYSLNAKFDTMIQLLSKLVNISAENANNMMSEALGPARI